MADATTKNKIVSGMVKKSSTKPVKVTYYNPNDPAQTRPGGTGVGAFNQPVQFGDVAMGVRKYKQGDLIYIEELKDVPTPYGDGVFRVNDKKNIRYNKGTDNFDIAIPDTHPQAEELKQRIGNNTFHFKLANNTNMATQKAPKVPDQKPLDSRRAALQRIIPNQAAVSQRIPNQQPLKNRLPASMPLNTPARMPARAPMAQSQPKPSLDMARRIGPAESLGSKIDETVSKVKNTAARVGAKVGNAFHQGLRKDGIMPANQASVSAGKEKILKDKLKAVKEKKQTAADMKLFNSLDYSKID